MVNSSGHQAEEERVLKRLIGYESLVGSLFAWIVMFVILIYCSVRFADPGPLPHWRHEFDTPAVVVGDNAWCVLDDTTVVLPGGTFCTGEGWDPE